MSWPRKLHCPECGSTDVDMRCAATVLLEVDEIREDGGFTVNYDEVLDLRDFRFKCAECKSYAACPGPQDFGPVKKFMLRWSKGPMEEESE